MSLNSLTNTTVGGYDKPYFPTPVDIESEPVAEAATPARRSRFGQILSAALPAVLNVLAPGSGSALGSLSGVLGGSSGGTVAGLSMDGSWDRQYQMILLQQQIQEKTQAFNVITNVIKAEHEAAMSAIRNLK